MGPKNLSASLLPHQAGDEQFLPSVFLMEPTNHRLKLNYKAGLSFLYSICVKCFAEVKVANFPFTFGLRGRATSYQVVVSSNDNNV